jgi:hypothetical protein
MFLWFCHKCYSIDNVKGTHDGGFCDGRKTALVSLFEEFWGQYTFSKCYSGLSAAYLQDDCV